MFDIENLNVMNQEVVGFGEIRRTHIPYI